MASAGASCESGPNDLRATDGEGAEERLVHPKLVVGVRIVDCATRFLHRFDGVGLRVVQPIRTTSLMCTELGEANDH